MTETEVKDKILNKIAHDIETANPMDLTHLSMALETLSKIGKPDVAERIANAYALSFGTKGERDNG